MDTKQLKTIAVKIKALGEEVQKQLGCGFPEAIFQNALAIEFRKNKIDYLKEVNIEIFYKRESVGVDRPDFLVTKIAGRDEPILLELKIADKISDAHRIQLKSYCTSLPRNNNPALKGFAGGVLMAFPAGDIDDCGKVKVFVTDPKFNILFDDQAEEDRLKDLEKEKQRKGRSK